MENFVVSARKYRPATFDSVVGQHHITNTLKNAISSKHLAQAFLFCGPRGVGKTTCARILAKTINCQNISPETEACNECESCKSFNSNSSFNIHELDAASNNSVEDIRNLVEQVRYAPQTGKYKIYIIDEVHMLSNQAFNAFLKTLEEPPSYAIFILATTERHKIIPTILSRCQIFDFNRIRIEDMVRHLGNIAQKESIQAEPDALHLISQKADGALRDALSIFDQMVTFSGSNVTYKATVENLHILDYDYYFRLTDHLLEQNLPGALLLFDEILKNGFDAHNFLVGIAEHFRSLLVCKDVQTVQLLEVSDNIKAKYAEQSQKSTVSFLLSGLNVVSACDTNYKSSKNQRLHVELCLMKLAHLNAALNFANEGAEVKKAKVAAPAPASTVNTGAIPSATMQPAHAQGTVPSQQMQQPAPGSVPSEQMQQPHAPNQVPSEGLQQPPKPVEVTPDAHIAPKAPVATEPSRAKVQLPPAKKLSKLPSLKDLNNASALTAEVAVAAEEEDTNYGVIVPIDEARLKTVWHAILRRKKAENMMEFTLLNRQYHLGPDNEIILHLDNHVMMDQFTAIYRDIVRELRSETGNRTIKLRAEVVEAQDDGRKLYTSQDKFNYLAEKFPVIVDMKQRFGLDTDF
ncbi:DNA polymerase III subunit gamma/tau [Pontibacter sp. BT310]|uniref:DNA polymerase III subunit gamma/tau n=1 Tax=Pontibacter populi TaxID=890055 RepID=A0ABS6XGP9_9BACT|nr:MULTISPECIES: DNA polymerase III subunit gamma/tau [Pontibacter]MBJ6119452.1 DNA polymerase III subunit gamma/tau [Pontibacter sp. BT310]MBR0571880.1 DNA polymerase III subunit gamma/tau [Microvirga sp. STS03]MBW3366306.1 DNA polymerase III subunit gamma/tau [Pontibacter populi]